MALDLTASEEFFKFHPDRFADDVFNAVRDYLLKSLDLVEDRLVKEFPRKSKDTAKVRLRDCTRACVSRVSRD